MTQPKFTEADLIRCMDTKDGAMEISPVIDKRKVISVIKGMIKEIEKDFGEYNDEKISLGLLATRIEGMLSNSIKEIDDERRRD